MVNTSVETWEEAGVKVVVYKNVIKWLKMCDIKSGLGVKNMSHLALNEIEGIYDKKRKELKARANKTRASDSDKYKTRASDNFVYIVEKLALRIIINTRGKKKKR